MNNSTMTTPATPLHPQLAQFYEDFRIPSGVLSLIIATLGVIFNLMNITVLLHPKMRNPVNLLLTMAAISQMCLLIIYLPHVFIFNLVFPSGHPRHFTASPSESRYFLFFADASLLFHMASSWLIITTACFRFIYVQFPLKSATFCNYKMAVVAGLTTIVACLLVQIPNLMLNSIMEVSCNDPRFTVNDICSGNTVIYTIDGGAKKSKSLSMLNLGLQAIAGRFIPTILLFIFTVFLMKVLRDAYTRKKRLHSDANSRTADSQKNEHAQTTKMLAAVVIMFFCVEFPHGILLGYVLVTQDWLLYKYLGEIIDLVTVIAFSVNLLLYSTMSRQYRNLFVEIFVKPLKRKIQIAKSSHSHNGYTTTSPSYSAKRKGNTVLGPESCAVSMTMDTHVPHANTTHDDGKQEEEISLVTHKEDN